MLIDALINFYIGYVFFTVSGGFPERFINLCSRMSIKAWDLRPIKGGVCGKCRVDDYRKLRNAARESGMKLRHTKKRGVPFFFISHRKHTGLFVFVPVFILFILIMSGRIWSVNINGNVSLSDEVIRNALKEHGITEGVKRNSLNVNVVESILPAEIDGLSWIAVNINGSVIHVEVSEGTKAQESQDPSRPCHIVASKDGYLRILETHSGTEIAPLNSAVTKGQLLISGIIEAKDKSVRFCRASGTAIAETSEKITVEIKKSQTVLSVRDHDFRLKLNIFNVPIPLGFLPYSDNCSTFSNEYRLTANGRRLPVACTVTKQTSYEKTEKVFKDKEAKLLLVSKLHEKIIDISDDCEIIGIKTVFSDKKSSVSAETELLLLENIGREVDILTDETPDQSLSSPDN